MIERNEKAAEAKDWKHEKKLTSINSEVKKLNRFVSTIYTFVQNIASTVEAN